MREAEYRRQRVSISGFNRATKFVPSVLDWRTLNNNSQTRSPWLRATPIASALAIVICLFGNLGAIGLMGPDEPRYVWIARAMAETGDWITPRLYGQPWFEKPILYYWAAAIGFRLHLSPEWAARLPSAVAALAAAIAIGWLGWKHYAATFPAGSAALGSLVRNPALLAPLLFSTSVAAIGFARAGTPDMLFSAFLTLAMAAAADVLLRAGELRGKRAPLSDSAPRDTWPLLAFGVFLGAAVLAKGPAGVLLAGGSLAIWTLATGKWRASLRLAHPVAIVACCVVALPWYALCARRNPDFLRVFILQHNFERYLTPLFRHQQPFWFFGPIVLLALLPWTILLWPAASAGSRLWRERAWHKSSGFFFACWAVFPVVFFSLSQSKLPSYVLPAIPAIALLCAIGVARAADREGLDLTFAAGGISLTLLGLGIGGFFAARPIPWAVLNYRYTREFVLIAGCVALLFVAAAAVFISVAGLRRQFDTAIVLCALIIAVSVEAANLTVLPTVDPLYSARSHAAFMRNDLHPDRIFTYHLSRSWNWGLAFYFRRELPEWSPADPNAALVLTTPAGLDEIRKVGRFQGNLDESYVGVLYVPINQAPR
jgi:4-amino-4-deoxy-L-arabinose transferase-like glycosyltransferase